MTIASAAKALSAVRPDIRGARRQIMLGQVKAESNFGYAFKTPDGSPSHNWGAIYASGDKGTFPVGDTDEGKPFTANAAWNSSAEVGARQYVNLIQHAYPLAYAAAERGDAWGYASGLWRGGPGSSAPPYYGGFPPGHKWSLAPKGTIPKSPLDYYYRKLAYAKMIMGAAAEVARVLGEPLGVHLKPPPPPRKGAKSGTSKSDGGLGLLALLGVGGFVISKGMR